MATTFEIEEAIEGDLVDTTDFFFDKIGESIPIKPQQDAASKFNLSNPPSLPLAVSERYKLIFVAHTTGFCVAKTKDVIDAAKEMKKGKVDCIQNLSVVDVPFEKVHILALSTDESTLVISVSDSSDVNFFSVNSLINKELKPSFTCSLEESSFVKDIRWTKKAENSFLVLSKLGKLYCGAVHGPLEDVMDNVDAVEWSRKGKFVAVAKKNILSILSSKFKERLSISLPFNTWIGDSGVNCSVKVDSIRWVRRDCIILGCFQLTADGEEKDYLVQVIRSKDGKITDPSAEPVVLSFPDLFAGFIDNIVPFGAGPYLFLSYLEQCELAIIANRKNTDNHVMLLGWSMGDEKNDVAVVEIERDKWLPRIELQDEGDDNLIMGLCIDNVSVYGKVKVQLGVEELKELPTHCILMCLTLEGKLNMFHVASLSGTTVTAEDVSALSDEEECIPNVIPVECDLSKVSSELGEQKSGPVAFSFPSRDAHSKELNTIGSSETPTRNNVKQFDKYETPRSTPVMNQISHKDTISANQELKDTDGQQVLFSAQQSTNLGQSSSKASLLEGHAFKDSSKTETQNIAGLGFETAAFGGKVPTDTPSLVNRKDLPKSFELGKESLGKIGSTAAFAGLGSETAAFVGKAPTDTPSPLNRKDLPKNSELGKESLGKIGSAAAFAGLGSEISASVGKAPTDTPSLLNRKDLPKSFELGKEWLGKIGSTGLQSASSQSWSSGLVTSSFDCEAKIPFSSSSRVQEKKSENSGFILAAADVSDGLVGKPFSVNDAAATSTSTSVDFSFRPAQGHRQTTSTAAGKIESLPSIRSTQNSSPLNFETGKSHNQKLYPSKDDYKATPFSGMLKSEPNSSKQSGNVKEMAKELDMLLESIEERGGFCDACTISQKSKVEELEQGIETLSGKCRMWRSLMDERLGEIQSLLDKTVEVLARKKYMEGIVKQASDDHYWDLWNRQKLSPELELKKQKISNLNQDLTNQLIQLERHFNTLELNKFGENDGVHAGRRAPQNKFGPSRHIQSLHTLHTTMSSQLTAAEQLSELLSNQMSKLSVESPSKQPNVKKELFETIGLPYDASFSSPDGAKGSGSSSMKKLLLSSGSAATKDQSRRCHSSAMKSYEPETARRRRDSLDRSWANFEPPKTTVKRMLLQERQKGSLNKSSLKDKKLITPHMLEGAAVVRLDDRTSPSASFYPSGNKGIQDTSLKQASENNSTLFRWANDPAGLSQSTGLKSPAFPSNIGSALSSHSASQVPPMRGQNRTRETYDMTADKSSFGVSYVEKSSSPISESETSIHQKSSIPAAFPTLTPSLPKKPSEMPNSNTKETVPTNSTIGNERRDLTTTRTSTLESGRSREPQFSTPADVPTASTLPGKVPNIDVAGQHGEKTPTSRGFSISHNAPFPLINSSSAPPSSLSTTSSTTSSFAMPFGGSLSSSRGTIDAKQTIFSSSLPLPSPSSSVSASSSTTSSPASFFPLQAPNTAVSSAPSSVNSTSDIPKIEPQLPTGKPSSELDVNAATPALPVQPVSPAVEFGSNPEPSVPSASAVQTSTGLVSGSQPSFTTMSRPVSNVTQPGNSSTANALLSAPLSTSASTTGGKNEKLDIAVTQEDEMEEEAPETSITTDLSLGNLSGFGIGSTPNQTAPKPNPFGGPFGNATPNPANSPFTMTVPSGEMFRPASFSYQPAQSSQPSQPTGFGAFPGGFGTGTTAQAPTQTGFGQPAQVGQGQQALGSVLGAFGQSRQFGSGLPGAGFGSGSAFGGGFSTSSSTGGATGGGFAGVGSTSGGFAGLASGGGFSGGFASAASSGGGFAGMASAAGGFGGMASGGGGFVSPTPGGAGFGGAASGGGGFVSPTPGGAGFGGAASGGGFPAAGGGFGGFANQQGSPFGGGSGGTAKPSQLFTQMRK